MGKIRWFEEIRNQFTYDLQCLFNVTKYTHEVL